MSHVFALVETVSVQRAVVLMGPRRVGKTVLIHHIIGELMKKGICHSRICYVTIDNPIYNGLTLIEIIHHYCEVSGAKPDEERLFLFFDEIQYMRNWESQLKALVDDYPEVRFMVSGSAAAALRLKSQESGAGRFTEFMLPPLTFYEYLDLSGQAQLVQVRDGDDIQIDAHTEDIDILNTEFIKYINFGGYPEAVLSPEIQADPGRFIKSDIIDKVLLRDLPSLYGVSDIQELNYLFTTLAFNSGDEVSLEGLSKRSGVAKNTIKRYIEYLEAAFLIKTVHRIDRSARRFRRANFFKVYLTNPSIRCALFSPVNGTDKAIGSLVETAVFSQWFHSDQNLHYARWQSGEVDIVNLGRSQEPYWAVEVKWSDHYASHPERLKSLLSFCRATNLRDVKVTTKSVYRRQEISGITLEFEPAAIYCYKVGMNAIRWRQAPLSEQ